MSTSTTIRRSILSLVLSNGANTIILFISTAIFARELGPDGIGKFFLFQASISILSVPADFGISPAIEKRISETEGSGQYLSSAIIGKIPLLVLLSAIIIIMSNPISEYIGMSITYLLIAALLFQELEKVFLNTLRGELRVHETATIQVSRRLIWAAIGYLLVYLDFGPISLVISYLLGLIYSATWSYMKIDTVPAEPSISHLYSLLRFGIYNAIATTGAFLKEWMDVLVIGLFLTQDFVGSYEIAWRVSALGLIASSAIATSIFPQMSSWDSNDDASQIENSISNLMVPSIIVVIPAFVGVVLYSKEILRHIFGEGYTTAWVVLIILSADKVFQSVHLLVNKALYAIDKPNLVTRASVWGGVINIVLNFALVANFGFVGAAIATVTSSIVNDLLHYRYLSEYISINIPWKGIIECISASTAMGLVLYSMGRIIQVNSMVTLVAMICFGVAVYLMLLCLTPTIGSRIRQEISNGNKK